MRARVAMVVAVLVMAMTAACSSDTETSSPVAPSADSSPVPSPTSPPASESGSPSEGPVADVMMSNFFFSPDQITVTSGDTLTLFNSSTTSSHSFTVPGQQIDVIVELQTEGEVTIALEAGTYDLICKFHESTGMVGTLAVEPIAA